MKLGGREAVGYFAKPDPNKTGLLIYGADAMRVALRRQEVIKALVGPNGDDEMRLARISAAELRKDPALLSDAIKAQGFFPGPRVAFVEDAADGLTKVISDAMIDWQLGDAQVIVTAKQLPARSKLRKLFEGHKNAFAVGLYDDPPGRDEIEGMMRSAGCGAVDRDGMDALTALSREIGPGDLRQLIEKLALFKLGDRTPLTAMDVESLAPQSTEAALDDVINIVAEGRTAEIGPVMQKLRAQGVQPVGLCIGAMRHFRQLHAASSDPMGAAAGMGKMRPPVFGPRRDRMLRQAQGWGMHKLETAIGMLTDTDLQLRSTSRAPQMASVERLLVRLSMLARR